MAGRIRAMRDVLYGTWRLAATPAWRGMALAICVLGFGQTVFAQGSLQPASPATSSSPQSVEATLLEKGHKLAIEGNCMGCHTALGSSNKLAGGYGIAAPGGTIYSANITPSKTAGIGHYTETQFARALREGIRADGAHLYPAMPYTSYTGLSDSDVHALYVYLMTGVKPVDTPAPKTHLAFPFNIRASMILWNFLFLKDRRFVAEPTKSAQWNRGAYLTNVLEHCSACHTPRNFMMAEDFKRGLSGAQLGPWFAPNITSDPVSGIGAWSDQALVTYLQTGQAQGKNQAGGGMAEAVQDSLQFLSRDDLESIVVYLKSTPPVRNPKDVKPAFEYGHAVDAEATLRGASRPNANGTLMTGAALFSGYCASCHSATGAGGANQAYPSLYHNTATGSDLASNLIAAILYGVDRQVGGKHVLMPNFGKDSYVQSLNDKQIAAISNYVLTQYGNPRVHVSPRDVAISRRGGPLTFLEKAQPFILPAICAMLVLILLVAAFCVVRRRRH